MEKDHAASGRGENSGAPLRGNAGSRHGRSKLTEELVTAIRHQLSLGARVTDLAAQYSVSQTTISFIKARRSWRHI